MCALSKCQKFSNVLVVKSEIWALPSRKNLLAPHEDCKFIISERIRGTFFSGKSFQSVVIFLHVGSLLLPIRMNEVMPALLQMSCGLIYYNLKWHFCIYFEKRFLGIFSWYSWKKIESFWKAPQSNVKFCYYSEFSYKNPG